MAARRKEISNKVKRNAVFLARKGYSNYYKDF
jgi:hypothetical protein